MTNIAEIIKETLPAGYTLIEEQASQSSSYYYINNPDNVTLKARLSNHSAMTVNSLSHVQVIVNHPAMTLDYNFEMYNEDGYEINELTTEEAARQLSDYLGLEISENEIEEADEMNCKLNIEAMSKEKYEAVIACYISNRITEVTSTILF
jgi:hypothetical protein